MVVQLLDVFAEGTAFVLAFELMPGDLGEMIRDANRPLTEAQVKTYMVMLLKGVAYLHQNNIMHRDLKPANLLINGVGRLKIADFGLCRIFSKKKKRLYSHQVATRWYRAPELLYGARQYTEGVDLWAVGCIFGELINKSPLFPGESDINQLFVVLQVLGTPSEATWPGLCQLPDYKKITFPEAKPVPLEKVLPDATPTALDLLKRLLIYHSARRLSAQKALQHEYLWTPPLPACLSDMPRPPAEKPRPPASREYPTHLDWQALMQPAHGLLASVSDQ